MSWLTDEIILYLGAAITVISLIGMGFCFFILKAEQIRLDSRFDEEYGKKQQDAIPMKNSKRSKKQQRK